MAHRLRSTAKAASLSGPVFPRLANLNGFTSTAAAKVEGMKRFNLVLQREGNTGGPGLLHAYDPTMIVLMYYAAGELTPVTYTTTASDSRVSGTNNFTFGGSTPADANFWPGWCLCLAGTTLTSGGTTAVNTDTSLVVPALTNFPNTTGSPAFPLVIGGGPDSNYEVVYCTAISGTGPFTLTVTRGLNCAITTHTASGYVRPLSNWSSTASDWMLNLSQYCPADPSTGNPTSGKTWAQYLAHTAAVNVHTFGADGIFLDNAWNNNNTVFSVAQPPAQADANNDNAADSGNFSQPSGWYDSVASLVSLCRNELLGQGLATPYVHTNSDYYDVATTSGFLIEHYAMNYGSQSASDSPRNLLSLYQNLAPAGATTTHILGVCAGDSGINTGSNVTLTSGVPADLTDATLQKVWRVSLCHALLGDGFYSFDISSSYHGSTYVSDETDGGLGSCLATGGVTSGATTLTLVAPAGGVTGDAARRFAVNDVVLLPYNANSGGSLGDEQCLVTAVNTGTETLTVTRGYNGTTATSHPAGTKVVTLAQRDAGRGWLGHALGAATMLPAAAGATQVAMTNPGFESGWTLAPWTSGSADSITGWTSQTTTGYTWGLHQEFLSPAPGGSTAAARINVTLEPGSPSNFNMRLQQDVAGAVPAAGTLMSVRFKARTDSSHAGASIDVSLQDIPPAAHPITDKAFWVTSAWRQYCGLYTIPAGVTVGDALTVMFRFGNLPNYPCNLWLDDVELWSGDINVWRRDFENGTALVNATTQSATIALGGTYHRIAGMQNKTTNDGTAVTSVTLAAGDAILLKR